LQKIVQHGAPVSMHSSQSYNYCYWWYKRNL